MRLLLDTHALVWATQDPKQLSPLVRRRIESSKNRVFVSLASFWELAVKESTGRLRTSRPLDVLLEDAVRLHGFEQMDVRLSHAVRLVELPRIHGDPFDRMLVAQAIEERCTLVTKDRRIQAYPVEHLW
jgi:PIN domain nuclease of toxin-antitoxin system